MQIAASCRRVCVCVCLLQTLQKIHYFRYALVACIFVTNIWGSVSQRCFYSRLLTKFH